MQHDLDDRCVVSTGCPRRTQPGAGADLGMRREAAVAATRLGAQQHDALKQYRRQRAAGERPRQAQLSL
jgi:hypothetical protein